MAQQQNPVQPTRQQLSKKLFLPKEGDEPTTSWLERTQEKQYNEFFAVYPFKEAKAIGQSNVPNNENTNGAVVNKLK